MVVLITGASHTGKTLLAQKLLEKYTISVTLSVTFSVTHKAVYGHAPDYVRRAFTSLE